MIAKRTIRNDGFLKPAYRITKRVARLMSKKPGKYIITLTPDYARQTKTTFTVKR
ncbi:hypothetical protein GSY69_11570 [Brevibacterium sp. 5221]|uniref:Uncharacterized protein n=1 Tax=Brevibacterium rongguiense TaxID=2695267 RepID=A0A6N9H9Y7_9MICO|nr:MULTISPECIES: hypothetical protein [Brevibacterium]MYM20581.1 hypothetical protein [Brevibacterium rongguiense]WAL39280.1 hypothetical protein BRM1_08270 [Brevibacterium sp. BRM-1]